MYKVCLFLLLFAGVTFYSNAQNQHKSQDSVTVFVSFMLGSEGKAYDIVVEQIECSSCSKKELKHFNKIGIETIQQLSNLPRQEKPVKMKLPLSFVLED